MDATAVLGQGPAAVGEQGDANENANNAVDEEEPRIIGGYEVLRAIGKGKFAVVYRAKRISDGEVVALKRIKVDAIDEVARQKCLKEIKLLQSLDHPNIIKYLDSFISDDDLVIIIEWAAAGDLKRQLRKAQERGVGFEERIIWKYFSQICDAMHHMHEKRIMHRDLKPANIFLTLDGTIKVGDLGLSRELSEHTIQAHSKVGTPLYMSPEVLRGDGYDFKSDVWSLGCLLYELAMLKSPFRSEGLNLYSLFQKISKGDYQPLPENYSEQLRTLAYSMISTRSEDRPELSYICSVAAQMRAQTARRSTNTSDQVGSAAASVAATASASETDPSRSDQTRSRTTSFYEPDAKESSIPPKENSRSTNSRENSASNRRQQQQQPDYEQREDDKEQRNSPVPKKSSSSVKRVSRTDSKDAAGDAIDTVAVDARESKDTIVIDRMDRKQPTAYKEASNKGRSSASGWDDMLGGNFSSVPLDDGTSKNSNNSGRNNSGKTFPAMIEIVGPQPVIQAPKQMPYTRPKAMDKSNNGNSSSNNNNNNNSNSNSVKVNSRVTSANSNRDDSSNNNDRSDDDEDTVAANIASMAATRNNGSSNKSSLEKASGSFALMETLYAKLCFLEYSSFSPFADASSRLLPIHFACDLNQIGRIAGYNSNSGKSGSKSASYYPQFAQMVEVAVFLFGKIGGTAAELTTKIDINKDAPMTVCKQLLSAASVAGIAPADLGDVLPTSLTPGYGEKVCSFLNLLADMALVGKPIKPLVYRDSNSDIGGVAVEGEGEDVEEEEAIGESLEFDDQGDHLSTSKIDIESDSFAMSIVLPSVDSEVWRAETERVSAALIANRSTHVISASSWDENYNRMKALSRIWTDENVAIDKQFPNMTTDVLSEQLSVVRNSVTGDIQSIARGEGLVGNIKSIRGIGHEFGTFKKDVDEKQKVVAALSQKTSESNNKFALLEEKFEELSDQLNSKVGNDSSDGGAIGSDNKTVVAMKEAIKSIKSEITVMDLQAGLLAANLLQTRMTEVNKKIKQRAAKRKVKQNGKGRGGGGGDRGDDEDVFGLDESI